MKLLQPNTVNFLANVHTIQARGVTRDKAWSIAAGVFPWLHRQVVLENSLPEGAKLSADGQSIIGDWPVTPDALRKLGLPTDATQQQYDLYHRAESVEVTPEIAAIIVRELLQFRQLDHAATFQESLDYLNKYKPELYKLAVQPQ